MCLSRHAVHILTYVWPMKDYWVSGSTWPAVCHRVIKAPTHSEGCKLWQAETGEHPSTIYVEHNYQITFLANIVIRYSWFPSNNLQGCILVLSTVQHTRSQNFRTDFTLLVRVRIDQLLFDLQINLRVFVSSITKPVTPLSLLPMSGKSVIWTELPTAIFGMESTVSSVPFYHRTL